MELENQHLLTILVMTDSGKNHQRIVNYWVKVWRAAGYLHSLKDSPARFLLITKRTTIIIEQRNPASWHGALKRIHHLCGISEPRHKKTSEKPKLRVMLQNYWPVLVKNINVMKCKGRLRNCSKLNESKEIWQWNAQCYLGFSFAIEDIIGTIF